MYKKSILAISFAMVFILLLSSFSLAQHKQLKTTTFDASEVTFIHGLGAIIKAGNKNLVVEMTMPKDNLSKEYKNVDLKVQDQIIMCNGKRVKTIDDLNEVINGLEIGADIEFGVKRDKEMKIVKFPKADPNAGGRMMMMTTTVDDDGGAENVMNFNGKEIKDAILIPSGLIVHEENGKLKIAAVLPSLKENVEGTMPAEGDRVVSLNGKEYSDAQSFRKAFHNLEVGVKVELEIENSSGVFNISFAKQKLENEVVIEK